ncbi:DUF6789 family protein [Acuticoccus sp.]|uniref:DUF6789 family protein n=1 Tax=Acuticoccus sp. TaxID=1904378 RepID=UPI003B5233CA
MATAVVSALLVASSRVEGMPVIPLLADLTAFNERLGLPTTERAVWVTHAVIGAGLYGVAFALLRPILPGRGLWEGVSFGLIAWLAMMVMFAPLAGREIFFQDAAPAIAVVLLALHVLYGALLGITAAALGGRSTA